MKLKTKLIFVLFLVGSQFSCTIHFSQIYSNRPKSSVKSPAKKIQINFIRVPESNLYKNLKNFNNDEFEISFLKSPYFILNKNADIIIKYKSKSQGLGISEGSDFLWAITLGGIPSKEDSMSDVEFSVVDKRSGKELGFYEYKIKQASWFGWLSVPASLFVFPFVDTVKELTTDEGLELHDRIVGRFSRDFFSDMKRGMYSRYTTPQKRKNKSIYIVLEGNETEKKYEEQSKMLTNLIEVSMVKGKYKLSDRKNISKILKEQTISQSGLTKSETTRIGQLSGAKKIVISNVIYYKLTGEVFKTTYIIHITDIESGEVEWKNLYTITGENIDEIFHKGSTQLLKDLTFAGYR